MLRMLRVLAAISFIWMVGLFLLRVTIFASVVSPVAVSLLATLGGELGFAMGIVALVVTANRRQIAWCVFFALLLVLLHVLPLLVFRPVLSFPIAQYPDFLSLFAPPPVIFGGYVWVVLLPALLPVVAFIYTQMVHDGEDSRPVVADVTHTPQQA